jgi:hypothetical protein
MWAFLKWLSTGDQVAGPFRLCSVHHQGMSIPIAAPGHSGNRPASPPAVLSVTSAIAMFSESAVRWRLRSGRWQRPCRGVLVTHSGAITDTEQLWVAVLAAGPEAVLGGITAARLDGLTGFEDRTVHLLLPASRQVRTVIPGTVVHRSRALLAQDVHPVRLPPRTRLARSLLDAAAWSGSDDAARAILAAGVQQRLVRPDHLAAALPRFPKLGRRSLIAATLADIAGGAEALSELDFCRLARRYRLPEPDRQVLRRDQAGRRRWLDAYWDEPRLVVEVDGLWHMDAAAWWADMRRDNELTVSGHRVLAWQIRRMVPRVGFEPTLHGF